MRVSGIGRLRGLQNLSWLAPRQLKRLADAMIISRVAKHGTIFDKQRSPEYAYVLLAGVARITCRNRKGERALVMMVAPGMIPSVPRAAVGIRYNFRCEAITDCQIGTVTLATLIEIALGIASVNFKHMVASYSGRWDLVQFRCSNFMGCTLEERIALVLLELGETFGIRDRQGRRLTVVTRHQDIAELVGASRSRITGSLTGFECKQMIVRDGRRLIVRSDLLKSYLEQRHSSGKEA